jgi:glycerol kinase
MVERAGVPDRLDSIRRVLAEVGATPADVAAIGITTHRETAFAWDRRTGTPVQNAIMWMSKQTDSIVRRWSADRLDPKVRARTGVNNDSYFTAPTLAWFMENVDGFAARARAGELAAGTVDTWLLWNLTGSRSHLTDHSQASRTARSIRGCSAATRADQQSGLFGQACFTPGATKNTYGTAGVLTANCGEKPCCSTG